MYSFQIYLFTFNAYNKYTIKNMFRIFVMHDT